MTQTGQISVARLFDGAHWHHNVSVSWQEGSILSITPAQGNITDATLVPGLIDIQVNGGGGALFNTAPTVDTLSAMIKAHGRYGTTALLPTVITDDIAVMQQAAEAIASAIRQQVPGIIGVHFEGPHLSQPKRGIHPPRHIRPISEAEWQLYGRDDVGVKLVTVAPENVSVADIRRLVALGVKVFLGHSDADSETVQAALNAGATGFTHLYNAMSPLGSRAPGMVGVALSDPDSWCGIILDGYHVHPVAAKVALAAKRPGKLVLVTDAMSLVGSEQSTFEFDGDLIRREGDKLVSVEGKLAGSVLDMASAVRYAVQVLGVSEAEALRMGGLYPAQCLGLPLGRLAVGMQADMVLLDAQYLVCATWCAGQTIF